jgi:translation initiation factor IF-3
VRCIDFDGRQIGVISTREALTLAHQRGMDLIEVSAQANPPVCRIAEYGKYKYEVEKKEKEARKHQSHSRVKEIKFHSNTDDHDFATKVQHIRGFIEEGHRVKVSLMFRGREQAHVELGFQMMQRVLKDVTDIATNENPPQQMGRNIYMMVFPRPALKDGKPKPAAPAPQAQAKP